MSKEQDALDLLAPESKVFLVCEKHPTYAGFGSPTSKCSGCWMVFYAGCFRKVPPSMRKELIEELYSIVRHMTEEIKAGKFDYQSFDHPEIKIEKET